MPGYDLGTPQDGAVRFGEGGVPRRKPGLSWAVRACAVCSTGESGAVVSQSCGLDSETAGSIQLLPMQAQGNAGLAGMWPQYQRERQY